MGRGGWGCVSEGEIEREGGGGGRDRQEGRKGPASERVISQFQNVLI